MTKPTVYLDTNVISAFWYSGADVEGLARRLKTREWWNNEREDFSVWASAATEDELAAHLVNPVAQARLEAVCRRLSLRSPLLVSPESIPKASLGQALRRRES